jgi:hypothetical protein
MGQYNESHGPLKLYVNDKVVAEGEIRTMTGISHSAESANLLLRHRQPFIDIPAYPRNTIVSA